METRQQACEVLQARRGMYEMLASLFFDTLTQEQIDAMAQQDFAELRADENALIASGFNDIWRYLRKRNTGTHQELSLDFSSCFLGTHAYKGFTAQPYESLFTDASGMLNAAPRREVHRLYKSERVALRSGYDYPDDHIAFECEFAAILCGRAEAALAAGDDAEALRALRVQRDFLAQHPCAWFGRLHDLCLRFIKTRFYRGVLNIAQGFLDGEVAACNDMIEAIESGLAEGNSADDELAAATNEPAAGETIAAEGAQAAAPTFGEEVTAKAAKPACSGGVQAAVSPAREEEGERGIAEAGERHDG